jgi:UDP-glucose 4-epimerase
MIHAFEKVSGQKLHYTIGPKRDGDIEAIYADNSKAKSLLQWHCKYNLEDIMQTAWNWEQKLSVNG